MVSAKVRSFTQRKKMIAALKQTGKAIEELESRMANMETVSEEEQNLYDNAESIAEKVAWLLENVEEMIVSGKLTQEEAKKVQENLVEKLSKIESDLKEAQA